MTVNITVFKAADRKNYVCQWVDPVTGRKKTRSTKTNKKRDAERFAGKLKSELEEGRYLERFKITWADFRERYETEVLSGKAEGTFKKATVTFGLIETLISPGKLAALDEEQISAFTRKLRERKTAEASIKSYLAHLKAALRWGKRMKLLADVPHIEMPTRVSGMKGRPITGEEFDRMVDAARKELGDRADSWIHLLKGLWFSGLRRTEAMRLHWTNDEFLTVDFSGRRPMFRIRAAGDKANKDRLLPMTPDFAAFLAETPPEDREGFVFNPRPHDPEGDRLSPDTVGGTIADLGKAANIRVAERRGETKYAAAHDLRRAFGFRWSSKLMPTVLQQLMRHASIQTTMEYYVGRNAQSAADAVWDAVSSTPDAASSSALANTSDSDAADGIEASSETPAE